MERMVEQELYEFFLWRIDGAIAQAMVRLGTEPGPILARVLCRRQQSDLRHEATTQLSGRPARGSAAGVDIIPIHAGVPVRTDCREQTQNRPRVA